MDTQNPGFLDFFKEIPDHRVDRCKRHTVEEILLVAFCGMIAGCDSWNDLELFGKTKLAYLKQYLPFVHGAPSDDTLRCFFRVLNPDTFEACFMKWVRSFQLNLVDKIVAIDGKTSRRSFDGEGRPMHLVSAFASEERIALGPVKTADKSNEITAIPKLLDLLDLDQATVTLDAMGCQSKIVDKGAHYVIGLKGNQSHLNEDTRLFFAEKPDDQSRIRKGNAPRNIAIIKKTVLNLLQMIKRTKPRMSLKAMRKLAGWDHRFLDSVLSAQL